MWKLLRVWGFFYDVPKETLSFPNTVFPQVAFTHPSSQREECFSGLRNGEREEYKEHLIALWCCCSHCEVTLDGCSVHAQLLVLLTQSGASGLVDAALLSKHWILNKYCDLYYKTVICIGKTSIMCCHITHHLGEGYVIPNCS